jgi:ankyrin repeat protein
MDVKANNGQRFTMGKQSSLAPARSKDLEQSGSDEIDMPENIDAHIRLMYLANEGDIEGIQELIESGVDVNFKDIVGRTALHVAACQGQTAVVRILLEKGAQFDSEDRWGSTVQMDLFFSLVLSAAV